MIDIKILRTSPEIVRKALHDKVTKVDLDLVIELDRKRVALQQGLDVMRARRNEISSLMGGGKPDSVLLDEARSLKENIQNAEKEFVAVETDFLSLYKKIPNIPTSDTPVGLSEDENVIVNQW